MTKNFLGSRLFENSRYLLQNDKETHLKFKPELNLQSKNILCNIKKRNSMEKFLKETRLKTYDETTEANKSMMKALNRTLRYQE